MNNTPKPVCLTRPQSWFWLDVDHVEPTDGSPWTPPTDEQVATRDYLHNRGRMCCLDCDVRLECLGSFFNRLHTWDPGKREGDDFGIFGGYRMFDPEEAAAAAAEAEEKLGYAILAGSDLL